MMSQVYGLCGLSGPIVHAMRRGSRTQGLVEGQFPTARADYPGLRVNPRPSTAV
jgi:hypothetical protein